MVASEVLIMTTSGADKDQTVVKMTFPFHCVLYGTIRLFSFQAPERFMNIHKDVTDQYRRPFLAMISALDESVGLIMDSLRGRNMMENTLVIFTSDVSIAWNVKRRRHFQTQSFNENIQISNKISLKYVV